MVIDAAGDDVSIRRAIREHHLRLFLDAVANGTDDPSVALAERHRLAGGNSGAGVDEAVQIAWFDASWERFAARESLRGDPLDLEQIAARIPPQEARALTAWALEVECDALLGAPAGHRFTPSDWEQCALVREQYVGLARVLDAGYPVDRARADVDALLGRDLEGSGASDEERAAAHTSAHEAFSRAHAMYTALAEHEPSRLLRRYVWGTQQHLGD
jgi:hypothetical protein